jgi:hypothetical protein
MQINTIQEYGTLNPFPSDIYQYKWVAHLDDNTTIESKWCNQKSYYNRDGFDSVSWTKTIKENNIKSISIYAKRDGQEFLVFNDQFDHIDSLSYSMIQWIVGYILIVGLTIKKKDGSQIEFLTNGTFLKR